MCKNISRRFSRVTYGALYYQNYESGNYIGNYRKDINE